MKWYLKNNKLHLTYRPPFKIRNGLKVLFYRQVDEREMTDYPVAYTDLPKSGVVDWIDGVHILQVLIRKPRWYGLLGFKWEVVEPMFPHQNR